MHIKKLGNCDVISVWREIIYVKGIVGGSVLGGLGATLDRGFWVVTEGALKRFN